MQFPTSFGRMDAGKIMQYWSKTTMADNRSQRDPVGSLVWDGTKVFTQESESPDHLICDFGEGAGEAPTVEQRTANAGFYTLAWELIPKFIAVMSGGMTSLANQAQMKEMASKVDSLVSLYDRFCRCDADCPTQQTAEDSWEADVKLCTCGQQNARGQVEDVVNEFKSAVYAICDEIAAKEAEDRARAEASA